MDRLTALFVEGMGAAAATSGILTQLQGRIFGLLYLHPGPMSLDDVTSELQQSKGNVSVNIRGLIDWQLVRQIRVAGSRRDHYEAATDFWRVMQEIMERRFRWNLRQVLAAAEETAHAVAESRKGSRARDVRLDFMTGRLEAVRDFFRAVDVGLSGFSQGESFAPQALQRIFVEGPRGDRRPRSKASGRRKPVSK
jgi:DNA-binding transcriptional regulator GbsR (MarR family)